MSTCYVYILNVIKGTTLLFLKVITPKYNTASINPKGWNKNQVSDRSLTPVISSSCESPLRRQFWDASSLGHRFQWQTAQSNLTYHENRHTHKNKHIPNNSRNKPSQQPPIDNGHQLTNGQLRKTKFLIINYKTALPKQKQKTTFAGELKTRYADIFFSNLNHHDTSITAKFSWNRWLICPPHLKNDVLPWNSSRIWEAFSWFLILQPQF